MYPKPASTKQYGKYLEMTSPGEFRLLEEIPEGTIDAHVHLGSYMRLPIPGGWNPAGPNRCGGNLRFHLGEIVSQLPRLLKSLPVDRLRSLEGLMDVAPLRSDLVGPGPEPVHLLSSIPGMFDPDRPLYTRLPLLPGPATLKGMIGLLGAFPRILNQANASNLTRYMRSFRIQKAVPLPVEPGRFTGFSPAVLAICRGRDEFLPFCSVHPRHPSAVEKLAAFRAGGARGLKFHPEFQAVSPDSKEARALFETCRTLGMPVQCHVGGMGARAKLSHPDRYARVLRDFPGVPFILCHMGLRYHEATVNLAASCDHIFLETSGQTTDVIRRAAGRIGADRILFGSDWPLYHPAVPISRVLEAFQKEGDRTMVFRKNMENILS